MSGYLSAKYATVIPEDSWVTLSVRPPGGVNRIHQVFATNFDVLTHCSRWLKRDRLQVILDKPTESAHALICRQCAKRGAA